MPTREEQERKGTFADLRGILAGSVRPLTDKELRQWIDEARSRAIENWPIWNTRRTQSSEHKQE